VVRTLVGAGPASECQSVISQETMTREEFKSVVRDAVETATAAAEARSQRRLPRLYVWGPADRRTRGGFDELVDLLTNAAFHSDNEISPCVDLLLDGPAENGRIEVFCYVAGYAPCKYGEHWSYKMGGHDAGKVGPFRLGCNNLVSKLGGAAAG
jgi:hypothetical protein